MAESAPACDLRLPVRLAICRAPPRFGIVTMPGLAAVCALVRLCARGRPPLRSWPCRAPSCRASRQTCCPDRCRDRQSAKRFFWPCRVLSRRTSWKTCCPDRQSARRFFLAFANASLANRARLGRGPPGSQHGSPCAPSRIRRAGLRSAQPRLQAENARAVGGRFLGKTCAVDGVIKWPYSLGVWQLSKDPARYWTKKQSDR